MSDVKEEMLSDYVRISRQYQRSIRIDIDLGRYDALEGYICHGTAMSVLDSMSRQILESNQRAFTWTGPFGGGKSSLAIALASALSRDRKLRAKARGILPLDSLSAFDSAFPVRKGWLTLPIVGKRSSVVSALNSALTQVGYGVETKKGQAPTSTEVIAAICREATRGEYDGVLIEIDEMGKFLEAAALGLGEDVYFFQELAETAARAEGKVIVVGILHQSFGQYATRLGIDTREDWSKVQGRYADIPLVAASDEVVELIGKAIEVPDSPHWMATASEAIASSIRDRRPAVGSNFAQSLQACWPLHPAMAALLGPISKRQFGQNERSTFGFLASVEPYGFRSYLENTPRDRSSWYRPNNYWDYLRSNLEPAILASPDGHRWSQAVEAVERTEARSNDRLHVDLIKNIAIIDLFRNGSGLAADEKVLSALFFDASKKVIEEALEQLSKWRVIQFKRHISSWSVFEGSDFDIDAALSQARATMAGVDHKLLTALSNLHPVVAKRHYHETGAMRWMNMQICRLEDASSIAESFAPQRGEFGLFLLSLPKRNLDVKEALKVAHAASKTTPWPVTVGVPSNHAKIDSLGAELLALQLVQSRHELSGDPVARREVQARLTEVRANLEEQLRSAVANAKWAIDGKEERAGLSISWIASKLADALYSEAPQYWSELINRESLSSNSVKARRDLLYHMLDNEGEENLGINGYPAERGLYETLLRSAGLYRQNADGLLRFMPPSQEFAPTFVGMWEAARSLFTDVSSRVSAVEIHKRWAAAPFGVRAGAIPVFMTVFMLAHKGNIAVYKDGIFVPGVTDADIDEYLQDPRRFSLRWIIIDEKKTQILEGIADILREAGMPASANDPLEAARGLVALVFGLPQWAQRTQKLSERARAIRDTLLKASDPHKVLFVDLAAILDSSSPQSYVQELREPVLELAQAYGAMLNRVESAMLDALDAPTDQLDRLRARAEALVGIDGDLRLEAFYGRLAKHDGSRQSVEGILSLAVNKPTRDWTDRDVDTAILEMAKVAQKFRQSEPFVALKGRAPASEAFAVIIGTGAQTKTLSREFVLSERHSAAVDRVADDLVEKLKSAGLGMNALLAVLARTGLRLTAHEEVEKSNG
jgi:hypothetical protein